MLKKNNQTIGTIYKGSTPIEKIYKGSVLVWEGWKKLIAQGIPPLTLTKCKENKLLNYQVYGNSIQNGTPTPDNPIEIVSVGDNETGLPLGYTQLDYIESTGTQYINTNKYVQNNIKVNIEFSVTTKDTEYRSLFGASIADGSGFYLSVYQDASYFNNVSINNTYFPNNTRLNYNFKIDGVYDENENRVLSTTVSPNAYGNKILLFARTRETNVHPNKFIGKIYSFKMYYGDNLEMDLIPCLDNNDRPCMYDRVTQRTFYNAGTGEFIAGNEIAKGGYKIPVKVNNITTNIYLSEPLRKIGDYADYIDFENKKVVRNVGVKVFDGTENWTHGDFFVTTSINHRVGFGLCTHLVYNSLINVDNTFRLFPATYTTQIQMTRFSSVNEIKTWLSQQYSNGTPMEIYYQYLEEDIIEESIELPDILLNAGTNIVDVETNLTPSNLLVKYKGK